MVFVNKMNPLRTNQKTYLDTADKNVFQKKLNFFQVYGLIYINKQGTVVCESNEEIRSPIQLLYFTLYIILQDNLLCAKYFVPGMFIA